MRFLIERHFRMFRTAFLFSSRVIQDIRLSHENYRHLTGSTQFSDNNSAATVGFRNRFTFSPGRYPLIRSSFGFDSPQWFVGFGNRYTFCTGISAGTWNIEKHELLFRTSHTFTHVFPLRVFANSKPDCKGSHKGLNL